MLNRGMQTERKEEAFTGTSRNVMVSSVQGATGHFKEGRDARGAVDRWKCFIPPRVHVSLVFYWLHI